MRIVSLMTQPRMVDRILRHLRSDCCQARERLSMLKCVISVGSVEAVLMSGWIHRQIRRHINFR